jgi:hypothetical protein
MKRTLVHYSDSFTNTLIVAENLEVQHKDLLRTVEKLIRNGMEEHFFNNFFTNKQNRTYPMYDMTLKASIALETIYLMSDKSERSNCDINKPIEDNDVVYFISNNKGSVKVGYTNAIRTRLAAIQLGCDSYCEIIATIKGGKDLEKQAHDFFKIKRLSGEWFEITEEDIYDFTVSHNLLSKIKCYDTISSLFFDLFHDSEEKEEFDINELFVVNTKEAMSKVLKIIKNGMAQKMHYKDIFHYAKDEVNKLADVLIFKPKNIRK